MLSNLFTYIGIFNYREVCMKACDQFINLINLLENQHRVKSDDVIHAETA